jgi:hypothetical protein
MAAHRFPTSVLSQPVTIAVRSSDLLPPWVPPAGGVDGLFNNVTRSNGTVQLGSTINPDLYAADGSPSPYPGLFYGTSGFASVWTSQAGGCWAPDLGAHGSFMLFAGGHYTWDGNCVLRFDLETGVWSNFVYPIYAATWKSVDNGTVATLTGNVSTRKSGDANYEINDRVNPAGAYIKYADDTPIPGTDMNPDLCTVWHPYPIHSNVGIHVVPASGGGGPKGTLVLAGHEQTGILCPAAEQSVWCLDLETKLWSRWKAGLGDASYSMPGLEWDDFNKVMWYIKVSGAPCALKFPERTKTQLAGPSLNQSGGYAPHACFMKARKLMVTMLSVGPAVASNTLNSGDEWITPIVLTVTPADRYRVLSIGVNIASGGAIITLQKSYDSSGGPWVDCQSWNTDTGENYLWSTDTLYDTTADRLAATGANIWYRIGIKAGDYTTGTHWAWMHCRIPRFTVWDVSGFQWGVANQTLPSYSISTPQDYWDGSWPRDEGVLMHETGEMYKPHGVNDRLEYCDYDDCLFIIDRPLTTPAGPRVGPVQTYIDFWRLRPPAVGREALDPWLWEKERIEDGTPAPKTGAGFYRTGGFPHLAGRSKYIPSLKCVAFTDRPEVPVQVIRSKTWV